MQGEFLDFFEQPKFGEFCSWPDCLSWEIGFHDIKNELAENKIRNECKLGILFKELKRLKVLARTSTPMICNSSWEAAPPPPRPGFPLPPRNIKRLSVWAMAWAEVKKTKKIRARESS
jgi:hypothetical protein